MKHESDEESFLKMNLYEAKEKVLPENRALKWLIGKIIDNKGENELPNGAQSIEDLLNTVKDNPKAIRVKGWKQDKIDAFWKCITKFAPNFYKENFGSKEQ